MKVNLFQPELFEDFEDVEPPQMRRGGDVDTDRIAAYMSNNPIVADARRMEEGGETSLSSNARTRKLQQYFLDRGLDLPPQERNLLLKKMKIIENT